MRSRLIIILGLVASIWLVGPATARQSSRHKAPSIPRAHHYNRATMALGLGYKTFHNVYSHKCMGVLSGSRSAGAKVVQWTCNGHADQVWNVGFHSNGGYWTLQNKNSGLCLVGEFQTNAQLWQNWCKSDSPYQQFTFQATPNNSSQFWTYLGPPLTSPVMCWDDKAWSLNSGSAIVEYPCTRDENEKWWN